MLSSNPHSGVYIADTARTLDAMNCGYPGCNQGGIAVVEQHLFENHSQDSRYKGPLDVCPMLPAQLGTGGNNQPFVVKQSVFRKGTRPHSVDEAQKWEEAEVANTLNTFDQGESRASELVVCLEDNGSRPSLREDRWQESETTYTLNTTEQPSVAYSLETFHCVSEEEVTTTPKARDYKDPVCVAYGVDCRNYTETPEMYPTLQAKSNGGQSLNYSGAVRTQYIVRRLTPTECSRLQGFPDFWGHPDTKTEFTDEEYEFWLNVRNTHAEINGKAVKDYTKAQMLTWYNKLHTDSAEYKLWGNGIALPTALYVMQGIAEVFK
jgi:DNA (cytosine-5)-methyltransferase 1